MSPLHWNADDVQALTDNWSLFCSSHWLFRNSTVRPFSSWSSWSIQVDSFSSSFKALNLDFASEPSWFQPFAASSFVLWSIDNILFTGCHSESFKEKFNHYAHFAYTHHPFGCNCIHAWWPKSLVSFPIWLSKTGSFPGMECYLTAELMGISVKDRDCDGQSRSYIWNKVVLRSCISFWVL